MRKLPLYIYDDEEFNYDDPNDPERWQYSGMVSSQKRVRELIWLHAIQEAEENSTYEDNDPITGMYRLGENGKIRHYKADVLMEINIHEDEIRLDYDPKKQTKNQTKNQTKKQTKKKCNA